MKRILLVCEWMNDEFGQFRTAQFMMRECSQLFIVTFLLCHLVSSLATAKWTIAFLGLICAGYIAAKNKLFVELYFTCVCLPGLINVRLWIFSNCLELFWQVAWLTVEHYTSAFIVFICAWCSETVFHWTSIFLSSGDGTMLDGV